MSEAPQTAPVEQPPVTDPAIGVQLPPESDGGPLKEAPSKLRSARDTVADVREALAQLQGMHLYAHQPWRTDTGEAEAMVLVRVPLVITAQLAMVLMRRVLGEVARLCDLLEDAEARAAKADRRAFHAEENERVALQWKAAAGELNERQRRSIEELQASYEHKSAELRAAEEQLRAREHLLGDIRHAEYQVQVLGERVDRQAEELRRARVDAALIYADRVAADPAALGLGVLEAQELAARACYRAGTYYTRSEAQRAMARVAGLPVPGAPRRRGRGGRRGGRRG